MDPISIIPCFISQYTTIEFFCIDLFCRFFKAWIILIPYAVFFYLLLCWDILVFWEILLLQLALLQMPLLQMHHYLLQDPSSAQYQTEHVSGTDMTIPVPMSVFTNVKVRNIKGSERTYYCGAHDKNCRLF